jgi:murein L,D-transpeptidase YcbB/YkuD
MNRIILTMLASTALVGPAIAAQNATPNQPTPQQQPVPQQQTTSQKPQPQMSPNAEQQNKKQATKQQTQIQPTEQQTQKQAVKQEIISPKSLTRGKIRQVQMALNKNGFNVGPVDGIWGSHTRNALQDFQKTKGMTGNGSLNANTLAALGVNLKSPQTRG